MSENEDRDSGRIADPDEQDRLLAEIESSDRAISADDGSEDPVVRRRLADALFRKADALKSLERWNESLAVWEEVGARFADDPPLNRPFIEVSALLHRADIHGWLDEYQAIVELTAVVVQRCKQYDRHDETVQRLVARALDLQRAALTEIDRDGSVEVDRDIVRRFGDSRDPVLRESVALALVHAAYVLLDCGRVEHALEFSRLFAERLASEPDESLEPVASMAESHLTRLMHVAPAGRWGAPGMLLFWGASACVAGVDLAFAAISRAHVARIASRVCGSQVVGLVNAARRAGVPCLLASRRTQLRQAIDVSQTLIARIGEIDDPELQRIAATARIWADFALMMLGHVGEGSAALEARIQAGDQATVQAFQMLASQARDNGRQAAAVGFFAFRARALAQGDHEIEQIAYDDSVEPLRRPDRPQLIRLFARAVRPPYD